MLISIKTTSGLSSLQEFNRLATGSRRSYHLNIVFKLQQPPDILASFWNIVND